MRNSNVFLAVSYDTEHSTEPYLPSSVISQTDYQQLPKEQKIEMWEKYLGSEVWKDPQLVDRSKRELETVQELGDLFASFDGKFTSFVLGRWLDHTVKSLGQETVRHYFQGSNIEIGSHSYNHQTYLNIADSTREKISPTLPQSIIHKEIERANQTIEQHLGVRPIGLRTPMGNLRPFEERERTILQALQDNGIHYVSSWLKAAKTVPNDLKKAQPFFYGHLGFLQLLEIPGVGFYDVHGTQPTRLLIFNEEQKWSLDERTDYYLKLLEEALQLDQTKPTFVPLVFHPWDVKHYDPKLKFHQSMLEFCQRKGIKEITYSEIYEMKKK